MQLQSDGAEVPSADRVEAEADSAAEMALSGTPPTIGEQPPTGGTTSQAGAFGVIVEDGVEPGPGQVTRSHFVDRMLPAIQAAANDELNQAGLPDHYCPYLERWLAHFSGSSAAFVENIILRYATPESPNLEGIESALLERVRVATREWIARPQDFESLATFTAFPLPELEELQPGAMLKAEGSGTGGPSEIPAAGLTARLGEGRPLEEPTRAKMERGFGRSFADVRLHTSPQAGSVVRSYSARALTTGRDVAFAPGEYAPGSLGGDLLMAHELAHVVQQGFAGGGRAGDATEAASAVSDPAVEWDASLGGLHALFPGRLPGVEATRLMASPRLRRCESCAEPTLAEQLAGKTDPEDIGSELEYFTDAELSKLAADPAVPELAKKVAEWEKNFRAGKWEAVSKLHRADKNSIYKAFVFRLGEKIVGGGTTIEVDTSDADFVSWVDHQLYALAEFPKGFQLLIELLATGQKVKLTPTTGGSATERDQTSGADAGRLVTEDSSGKLPKAQQHAGTATGSEVRLNKDIVDNQVVLSKTAGGGFTTVPMPPEILLGHELIHALHNAKGESLAAPFGSVLYWQLGHPKYMVVDPDLGEPREPEDIRTISGQTKFAAPPVGAGKTVDWATDFNLPAGITENDLRAERGLDLRASHSGGSKSVLVPVAKGETVDQMVARYSMADKSTITPQVAAAIKEAILDLNPALRTTPAMPAAATIELPHRDYVVLFGKYVRKLPGIDESLGPMNVRGAP